MATAVQVIQVPTHADLEQMITSYLTQGFVVANKTTTSATMIKRKTFSVLWAVVGFLVCLLPLLVYLIVYAAQSDQVVEIRVSAG